MAKILSAKCIRCDYSKKNLKFGGQLVTFESECMVPAYDVMQSIITTKNYFHKHKYDENIRFYNETAMYNGEVDKRDDASYFQWLDIILKKEKNKCPSCQMFGMDFEETGTLD